MEPTESQSSDDEIRPPPPPRRRRLSSWIFLLLLTAPPLVGVGFLAENAYVRYQKKSRQSEAKTNLSGLFTAEKSFFGEYMTYTTDLVSLNWYPDGEPLYVYGFCNEFPTGVLPGIPSFDGTRSNTSLDSVALYRERDWDPVGLTFTTSATLAYTRVRTAALGDPCALLEKAGFAKAFRVTGQDFVAFAIGNIDGDDELDIWSINQVKQLDVLVNDAI